MTEQRALPRKAAGIALPSRALVAAEDPEATAAQWMAAIGATAGN